MSSRFGMLNTGDFFMVDTETNEAAGFVLDNALRNKCIDILKTEKIG